MGRVGGGQPRSRDRLRTAECAHTPGSDGPSARLAGSQSTGGSGSTHGRPRAGRPRAHSDPNPDSAWRCPTRPKDSCGTWRRPALSSVLRRRSLYFAAGDAIPRSRRGARRHRASDHVTSSNGFHRLQCVRRPSPLQAGGGAWPDAANRRHPRRLRAPPPVRRAACLSVY
ncbi:unnamed protein product [Rangifer tarandus platyrhynchus]